MGNKHRLRKKSGQTNKKLLAKLAVEKRWTLKQKHTNDSMENVAGPSCEKSETKEVITLFPKVNKRILDFESNTTNLDTVEDLEECDYLFMHVKSLQNLVEALACPKCLCVQLFIEIEDTSGFAKTVKTKCKNCAKLTAISTSPKVSDKSFDVNRRVTQAFTTIGKGYAAVEQFSVVMNMMPMSNKSFHYHSQFIYRTAKKSAILKLCQARQTVREYYKELDPLVTDDSILDLSVSYDGTWHKRGFTSNYGVGCVIEVGTGLVIDFCVLSKFCRNCVLTKAQLGEDSAEFYFWYNGHEASCDKNYDGSSPSMETYAAEILWKRSISYKFRYSTVVSDGDSKVYSHLCDLNVYGDSLKLSKEECVNHVSKRLGTALRNLVKTCRAQKITLGGKSRGSLKESTILKLTRYYHNAIAGNVNTDVMTMRNAALATLHHCVSTDSEPKHTKCPTGINSWCFYNRALANNEIPGSHNDNLNTPISLNVLKYIAPVYQRLTSKNLLERCLRGQTQNSNESLHSRIWKYCDKTKTASKRMIEAAVAEGIGEYNFGSSSLLATMVLAKVSPGKRSLLLARRRDNRRKVKSKKVRQEKYQKRKMWLRLKNLRNEELKKEEEGVTYGAGEF